MQLWRHRHGSLSRAERRLLSAQMKGNRNSLTCVDLSPEGCHTRSGTSFRGGNAMDKMERLVFFGKGGIGKSTTSNISATFAGRPPGPPRGLRPEARIHRGAPRRADDRGGRGQAHQPRVRPEDIVDRSRLGIDCVEAGGPSAGVGCGGRDLADARDLQRSSLATRAVTTRASSTSSATSCAAASRHPSRRTSVKRSSS